MTVQSLCFQERWVFSSAPGGVDIQLAIRFWHRKPTGRHIFYPLRRTENSIPIWQSLHRNSGCKQGMQKSGGRLLRSSTILIEYQQSWMGEGNGNAGALGTSDFYPLYNVYDNADEIEVSYDCLKNIWQAKSKWMMWILVPISF